MRSFKIDDDGDLEFSEGSPVFVESSDALAQRTRSRLRTVRGEWFLDESIGLPFSPTEADIRTEIEAVEGIDAVTSLSIDFDRETREQSVTFTATTDDETELAVEGVEI